MDLCHVSLKYDGYESLRGIYSESTDSCHVSSISHIPYLLGSSGFGNLISQLKPCYTLPGAHDLLTSVTLQIDASRLFIYSGFGNLKFQAFLLLRLRYLMAHIHLVNPMPEVLFRRSDGSGLLQMIEQLRFHFGFPDLRASKISSLKP
jgi:hypothetical protein